MPNDELINFIKQSREAGQTDEQIKSALQSAGWQEGDIEEGFKYIISSNPPAPAVPPSQSYSRAHYDTKPAPIVEQKSGSGRKLIIAVVVILIFLTGGAGAYYYKDNLRNLPVIKKFFTKEETANNIPEVTQEQQATVPATSTKAKQSASPINSSLVDCGVAHTDDSQQVENITKCFDNKFKECTPAKFILDATNTSDWARYYEIIGSNDGLCSVKNKYTQHPNPGYVGKEMICKFDSKKYESFSKAMADLIGNCSGPLYVILTTGNIQ